jgi:photosystem II stability/assembly factor-like uncharacterized protein
VIEAAAVPRLGFTIVCASQRIRKQPLQEGTMNSRIMIVVLTMLLAAVPGMAQIWEVQNSGTTDDLKGVTFVDSLTGWAVGGGNQGGTILRTTDGGATWNLQNSGTQWGLYRVTFANCSTGWVAGMEGTILHTTNGGTDWVAQDPGPDGGGLDVSFVNDSTGWIIGGAATVLHTTNSGETWIQQPTGFSFTPKGLTFVDSVNGWVVGWPSMILHTGDGGAIWVRQGNDMLALYIFDAAFTDVQTGWAVGLFGEILHTDNGGATWVEQTSGSREYLAGAAFLDNLTGWVVGTGTILHTTDGGITWTPQSAGTGEFLSDVAFTDGNSGWVVGSAGTILRYRAPNSANDAHAPLVPNAFFLEQNYPNPFNPSTTLRFGVPVASEVMLNVFDLQGRVVQHLFANAVPAGVHAVSWDCPGCPSGTYLARLQAGSHVLQRRMVLVK